MSSTDRIPLQMAKLQTEACLRAVAGGKATALVRPRAHLKRR